jgi:cold shock protein
MEVVSLAEGTIKWFNGNKGYGFIQQNNGPDLFLHYSSINMPGYKSLEEGDPVEFDIVESDRGLQAKNVIKKL